MKRDDWVVMREWLGDWDAKPQLPSPGPWTYRPTMVQTGYGIKERVWIVVDVNGRCVAECDSQVDAELIANVAGAHATEMARKAGT